MDNNVSVCRQKIFEQSGFASKDDLLICYKNDSNGLLPVVTDDALYKIISDPQNNDRFNLKYLNRPMSNGCFSPTSASVSPVPAPISAGSQIPSSMTFSPSFTTGRMPKSASSRVYIG